MADLQTSIDPNTTESAQKGFETLPNGWYNAHITETEVANTKSGTGLILKLQWEVVDGEHERRRVFQNINYANENPKAEAIGKGQLKDIMDAIGYTELLTDSDVLLHQVVRIKVGLEKPKAGYDDKNKIMQVKPYGSEATDRATASPKPAAVAGTTTGGPARPAATLAKAAVVPPAGAGARPWKKSA